MSESAFYPLSTAIHEGMPMVLRSRRGELALGRVRLLRPDLQVGVVELGDALGAAHPGFEGILPVYAATPKVWRLSPGKVYLGGRALFSMDFGRARGRAAFHPLHRRFLRIYPPAELLGSGASGHVSVLSLRLMGERERAVSVPLSSWRRALRGLDMTFDPPGILRPIQRPSR